MPGDRVQEFGLRLSDNPVFLTDARLSPPLADCILATITARQSAWTEDRAQFRCRIARQFDLDALPLPILDDAAGEVMAFDLLNRGGRSSLAFGIVAQQPCRRIGDVQPSVSRDVILGAAISSLAEKFNRTSAMPSYELASDVFNKIVVVHDRHNSGLTVFAPAAGAKTWLIGRMSRKIERLLGLVHGVE